MTGPLDQWLGYRDCLPLQVDVLASAPSAAEVEHWHDQNMRTLHAVAVLDERHQSRDVTGKTLEDDVERLHQKLDVVLELLGSVIRANRSPVPSIALRLSREGVCWPAHPDAPAAGANVVIRIELHPCAPAPLCWLAQVVGEHAGEVCARFHEMSEVLAAALERFVFIRHRRSVAGARSPGAGPTT